MAASAADDVSVGSTNTKVRLRVQGLRRLTSNTPDDTEADDTSEETILLPSHLPVSALWDKLKELDYDPPDVLYRNGKAWRPGCTKTAFKEFEKITVVEDHLCDPSKSIHVDDRLIAYTNRRFGQPIQFNIDENTSNVYGIKVDSLKDSPARITWSFPLHSVAAYSDKLPDAIVQEGGVFMPMWQREALWVSLEAPYGRHYALRFSLGRINAVSGLQMDETKEVPGDIESAQDYVVVPGQEWLDGICVASGIVRQFVAMPLGSGYTVEGQKTGKEKHGGLQIEVIPSFEVKLRSWVTDQNECLGVEELLDRLVSVHIDEFKTPRELGLEVGATIRLYPAEAFEHVPSTLLDMADGGGIEENGPQFTSTYTLGWRTSSSSMLRPTRSEDTMFLADSSDGVEDTMLLADSSHDYSLGLDVAGGFLETVQASTTLARAQTLMGVSDLHMASEFLEGELLTPGSRKHEILQAEREPKITTKDLKAMGLAAGGKLVQDIYRDHNPAHIWNTEAARIVHVHILDPASCEAVTHVVPPPPPIDAMGYIEEGGAFFVVEEQPENRVEGGDFDNVESVSAVDKGKGVRTEPSLDPNQPTQCKCGIRLCDCVVRPCDHQFCNVCVREIDPSSITGAFTSVEPQSRDKWFCPTCKTAVSYVAGFSAPMNLPGEDSVKVRVPVNVLEVKDGRVAFKSIQRSRL
ncbi:hypothetical protein CLAIMM_03446 isoform 2 [Cladophialophora immunda]|nr:hypothetical protein CLAIMM_03446 isoform 2 [Cladophialophora immunda]